MGFVCPDGCYTNCNGCSGCRGCSGTCSGTCKGNCKGTCSGTCSGGCGGGCKGTCKGYCSGCSGCGGDCSYDCTYSCSGGCSSCSGSCSTACNTTCKTTVQATNIANLTLNDKFMQSDITKIKDAIKFEVVDRRGKTLSYTVTFAVGEAIDDAKITQIIANLKQAGQTASYSASAGSSALKDLGTDLIAKIKAANNEKVGLPL